MSNTKTNLSILALVSVLFLQAAGASGQASGWKKVSPLQDPRTGTGIEGGSASLIGNFIYVSHGYRGFDSALLSIYDIGLDTWTHGGPTAPDPLFARSEMAGGTAFGKHYAIGGRPATTVVEEFDPGAGTWATVTSLNTARAGLGGASSSNKIYALGGRDGATFGSGTIFGTNEEYDPTVGVGGTWTVKAPMLTPVSDVYATIAYGGKVYVFGGATSPVTVICDVQIYDIALDSWSLGAPMPTCRAAAMAGVCGNEIAVFAGYDPSVGNLAITELYDPANNSWSVGPALNQPVSEVAQGVTYNSTQVFSIGTGIFGPSGSVVQALNCGPPPIPAVSEWGLAVLTLIGLVCGTILFGRSRVAVG